MFGTGPSAPVHEDWHSKPKTAGGKTDKGGVGLTDIQEKYRKGRK